MRNLLGERVRPAFLVRLSHLIVLQMIFVFAAISLLVLQPEHMATLEDDYLRMARHCQELTDKMRPLLSDSSSTSPALDSALVPRLAGLFVSAPEIEHAVIYLGDQGGSLHPLYEYQRSRSGSSAGESDGSFDELIHGPTLRLAAQQAPGALIPCTQASGQVVYYYPFEIAKQMPAVLVSVTDHQLLIASKGRIRYGLILLFLSSTLVSLLMVYLIYNRFRAPLRRLRQGLQKTTEGEVFYHIEPEGAQEVHEIAESFNKISHTLWKDQQHLKRYNEVIRDAYLANLESQAFLATLIDSSPCCILATSVDGEIVICNRKAVQVFAFQETTSPLGRQIDELFTHSVVSRSGASGAAEFASEVEVTCQRADGTQFPAYLVTTAIRNGEGQVSAWLFILLDISESQNFQEMMVQVDRYRTRGEMAGDIAHEINNYLAVLSGNLELLPLYLRKNDYEKIEAKLVLMRATVERISRFTDGLMDVNHGEADFQPADINQLIQNLLVFLKPQNRFDGTTIDADLAKDLPFAEVDVEQLQQLLVNFIHNAGDAIAETATPTITIVTRAVEREGQLLVRIEVRDNGPGVPEERREDLFERRFTTKRRGHGYGLVTCRRIAEAHGGRVGYECDRDSVFFFEVPVRHRVNAAAPTGSAATSTPSK